MSFPCTWTRDDEHRLLANSHLSAKELAPLFGKTENAVHIRLSELNRKRRRTVQDEKATKVDYMMMVATRRKA